MGDDLDDYISRIIEGFLLLLKFFERKGQYKINIAIIEKIISWIFCLS